MAGFMRILNIKATNFSSYAYIDIDLQNRNLTLIQGATGSGKSTLCDLAPWALFGKTAKGGAVDEIRSWNTDEPTEVDITLSVADHIIRVVRRRGKNPKDNDLRFYQSYGDPQMGKDLVDTQKLLDSLLNLNIDLYLASAYFHEFSQTAQFFTTTAKNRRTICEQIVDLSLPKKLTQKITDLRKVASKDLEFSISSLAIREWKLKETNKQINQVGLNAKSWAMDQANKRQNIIAKQKTFEADKLRVLAVLQKDEARFLEEAKADPICSECGATKKRGHKHNIHNPFAAKIDALLSKQSTYDEQLANLANETNPYIAIQKELKDTKSALTKGIADLNTDIQRLTITVNDLDTLTDAVTSLRSSTIIQAISDIEHNTNNLLSTYFDAEIKVEFTVTDADKLDVVITKDGNQCSYTQLSKGQRQMLKLCFGVSVMRQASNHSGVNLTQVWFDEALDGLDDTLKLKAYKLLEALALQYESVFVVEHSTELKAVFPNSIKVQLVEGISVINDV